MVERDKSFRPKATRNAGAFLGPFTGIIPVPSDMLDRHWSKADRKSGRGRALKLAVLGLVAVTVFLVLFALTPPG